jgi:hypothetical protein
VISPYFHALALEQIFVRAQLKALQLRHKVMKVKAFQFVAHLLELI